VVKIRPAGPDNVLAIAELLDELDRFYGAPQSEPLHERTVGIWDALFGLTPAAHGLLAWDGAELAGIASYSFLWPAAGVTRSLYVKELYVRQASRRKGVGALLMYELAKIAAAHKCSLMEWTTEPDNLDAQQFYMALGMELFTEKVFYRVSLSRVT